MADDGKSNEGQDACPIEGFTFAKEESTKPDVSQAVNAAMEARQQYQSRALYVPEARVERAQFRSAPKQSRSFRSRRNVDGWTQRWQRQQSRNAGRWSAPSTPGGMYAKGGMEDTKLWAWVKKLFGLNW